MMVKTKPAALKFRLQWLDNGHGDAVSQVCCVDSASVTSEIRATKASNDQRTADFGAQQSFE